MSKALVAYFSASGVTAKVAHDLATVAEADVVEIRPAVPYTAADLDWNDPASRSTVEMHDEAARPAFVRVLADVAAYDRVYIGFPMWWFVEPRIIDTFLEAYDFAGKEVVIFATSVEVGLGETAERIGRRVPAARVLGGSMLNGAPSCEDLRLWVESFA